MPTCGATTRGWCSRTASPQQPEEETTDIEYLALLTDEERDRIIEAQEWKTEVLGFRGGARCMIGHAEDPADDRGLADAPKALAQRAAHVRERGSWWNVGSEFDRLCRSVGLPVAVARIKAECARLNGAVPAPARETVGAA